MATTPIQAQTPNQIAASQSGRVINNAPANVNNNPYGTMDYSNNINGVRVQNAPLPISGNPTPQVSNTTISNTNKINQTPAIQNTTQNLSQKGSSYDANGNVIASNGTVTPPQTESTPPIPGTYTDSMGQVHTAMQDGTTPPAGATADGKGNYIGPDGTVYPAPAGDTSHFDKQIFDSIDSLKAQVSANLASALDSIKNQFNQLITQSKQVNASQVGKLQNALLMGGVTGQGSTSQYASTSADSQVTDQLNYGLQKIAELNVQEDQAIQAAQNAALTQDIQLQDYYNQQINKARDAAQAIATEMQKSLMTATQQASKDNAITKLYLQGTTSPSAILANLRVSGRNDITLKDINDSISAQVPPAVMSLIDTATKNGAKPDLISQAMQSGDINTALKTLSPYLQTASGALGDYLEYQRQGGIQNYDAWTKAQEDYKNQEAIKLEQAKAAITASNTGLNPNDITSLVNTLSDYQGKKYLTSTDLEGYDTKQKAALITALKNAGIQTLSPKDSDAINTIQAAQGDLQNLSSAINNASLPQNWTGQPLQYANVQLNRLLQTNPNIATYKTNLLAVLPTLSALRGVGSGGGGASRLFSTISELFPQDTDTLDVAQKKLDTIYSMLDNGATSIVGKTPVSTQKQQDAQDISSIQTFHDASPDNAKKIDDLHTKFPNASPGQIKQALGL